MKNLEILKSTLEVNSIVNEMEIKQIKELLEIEEKTNEQLMEMRKDVIIYCDDIQTDARMQGDWETYDTYRNLSSKICAVIEQKIWEQR